MQCSNRYPWQTFLMNHCGYAVVKKYNNTKGSVTIHRGRKIAFGQERPANHLMISSTWPEFHPIWNSASPWTQRYSTKLWAAGKIQANKTCIFQPSFGSYLPPVTTGWILCWLTGEEKPAYGNSRYKWKATGLPGPSDLQLGPRYLAIPIAVFWYIDLHGERFFFLFLALLILVTRSA